MKFGKRKVLLNHPLLIFDFMQTHLTDTEKSACKKTLATIAAIPGGLTKILQPLDITINYAFKCEIHKHWKEWICSGTHSFTKSGYMRKLCMRK